MNNSSVLVVDDEPDIRSLLQEILEDEGFDVSTADNAEAANNAIQELQPDLVLLDIWMPGTDGVTLLKSWKKSGDLKFPVIMISGHGTVETAVEATRHGAVDFIEKPLSLAKLLLTVERALNEGFHQQVANEAPTLQISRLPLALGVSDYVKRLQKELEQQSKRMSTLLLQGESGSGRVLFAQYAHDKNPELTGAFIQLRCDTLSNAHCEKELFGEEVGEAVSVGYLEAASNGTLFLNDVELLPHSAQELLRQIIDQQAYSRVGSSVRINFRARLVASSRTDLSVAVKRGQLDATLAQLLSVDTVHVNPLREHPEDIPALLEGFVNWHVEEEGLPYRHFTVAAQNRLRNLNWPGNLLELKNLVQRILLLGGPTDVEVAEVDRALGVVDLSEASIGLRHDLPLREARADFERQYLLRCLQDAQGNIGDLAKHVGMERTHLYRKLRNLEIDLDKVRE